MTLQAWQEYRLIDVERLIPQGQHKARRVDTVECVGTVDQIRYRDYKRYNPDGGHDETDKTNFRQQFEDYATVLGPTQPFEYVFATEAPSWAREMLTAGAANFKHGLWLTDAATGHSERLDPGPH
jgi:hypothetical protein